MGAARDGREGTAAPSPERKLSGEQRMSRISRVGRALGPGQNKAQGSPARPPLPPASCWRGTAAEGSVRAGAATAAAPPGRELEGSVCLSFPRLRWPLGVGFCRAAPCWGCSSGAGLGKERAQVPREGLVPTPQTGRSAEGVTHPQQPQGPRPAPRSVWPGGRGQGVLGLGEDSDPCPMPSSALDVSFPLSLLDPPLFPPCTL